MSHKDFDPNGYAAKNGNFIGLPYTEEEAQVIFLPVPWEATVSSAAGTAGGPANILEASYQLDLLDWAVPEAWNIPLYFVPPSPEVLNWNAEARPLAAAHIERLENEQPIEPTTIDSVNLLSNQINQWVYATSKRYLERGQLVGLLGGEHSVPFGYLQALSERYADFGILQLDAHADLRVAYEDFSYSHASIFYNVLETLPQVTQLTQVGLRDIAPAERAYAQARPERLTQFGMAALRQAQYQGCSYHEFCQQIIATLPKDVYISFDVDGLDPALCPNTGTPVPGGLAYEEAIYLLEEVVRSGRRIIGFDLCEVAGQGEWDGNVGARLAYKLALLSTWQPT